MVTNFDNVDYYEYVLDSYDSIRPYQAGFDTNVWPFYQFENPVDEIEGLKILQVIVPFSFYTVNTLNNTFIVNNISDATTHTITVPVGTYTAATLVSTLQSVMTATTGVTWTVSYDNTIAKLNFSTTPVKTFNFEFGLSSEYLDDDVTNMRRILGFGAGTTLNGTSQQSPNVPAITGPDYLYLNSETIGPYMNMHLPAGFGKSNGGLGPECCKFANNADYTGLIVYDDPYPQHFFTTTGINSLQAIDFYLTLGRESRALNLNGLGFQVKLGIFRRKVAQNSQYMGVKRMRAI